MFPNLGSDIQLVGVKDDASPPAPPQLLTAAVLAPNVVDFYDALIAGFARPELVDISKPVPGLPADQAKPESYDARRWYLSIWRDDEIAGLELL
ncbi:MAG: hypothetical protein HY744_32005, partial [Deltaproteobacteria bacterium]|nr:hypothetical protein [Deltaproteobacteria bacterium]